jgi:acyl carrier protein
MQIGYPLALAPVPGDALRLELSFDSSRYSAAGATAVLAHFRDVLFGLTRNGEASVGSMPAPSAEQKQAWSAPKAKPEAPPAAATPPPADRPPTELETQLVAIFMEALALKSVGINDSFLKLGGHSLAAMKIVSKILEQFAVELPLQDIYKLRTIARIAAKVEELQATAPAQDELLDELEDMTDEEAQALLEAEEKKKSGGHG